MSVFHCESATCELCAKVGQHSTNTLSDPYIITCIKFIVYTLEYTHITLYWIYFTSFCCFEEKKTFIFQAVLKFCDYFIKYFNINNIIFVLLNSKCFNLYISEMAIN